MSQHRIISILLATSIAVGAFVLPGPGGTETVAEGASQAVTSDPAVATTPEFAAMTDWALQVFADAGLDLPADLPVEWDTTLATCDGVGGRYRGGAEPRVIMCATGDRPTARRTLLHELAHAWEAATLTDDKREEYRAHLGLPTWLGHDHPWGHRAGEYVAEIVAWGLSTDGLRLVSVAHDGCGALAADYEWLTGTRPPAGVPEGCEPIAPVTTTTVAGGIF